MSEEKYQETRPIKKIVEINLTSELQKPMNTMNMFREHFRFLGNIFGKILSSFVKKIILSQFEHFWGHVYGILGHFWTFLGIIVTEFALFLAPNRNLFHLNKIIILL